MLNAFRIERTLNRKGSFSPYFLLISVDISAWLSWTKSRRLLCVSTSLEGKDGCVPIHSSAYGFSCSMESLFEGVAAANFAAADSCPTLPALHIRIRCFLT